MDELAKLSKPVNFELFGIIIFHSNVGFTRFLLTYPVKGPKQ